MWQWRSGSGGMLLLGLAAAIAIVSGCSDDAAPAPTPVAGGGRVVSPEPGPPPVIDEPGLPPVAVDPPPPDPVTIPEPVSEPVRPSVPAGKAIEVVTRAGRKRAVVAAGVELDSKLFSKLGLAGGLHEIDLVATGSSLLRVVPVIRRFPELTVDFPSGRWIPGRVTLNERATVADIRAVSTMREVRGLDLSSCRLVDSELTDLSRMIGLESLFLPPTTTDGISAALVGMRSLKSLSLEATAVTSAGLATLPRSLEELNLSSTSIDDEAVEQLRRLPGLKRLWLDETSVGDKSLGVVSSRTTIEVLGLTGTLITSDGLKQLAGLVKLRSLYLGETSIDDTSLGVLMLMKQLKVLDVTETGLSVSGRQALVESLRTAEVRIDLDALVQAIEDAGGRIEKALPRIARVTRNQDGQVESLNVFAANFSDIGMSMLRRFPSLKRLSVEGTLVTDVGLKHLSSMTQLEELWLSRTSISDPGLAELRPLRSLRQLHLSGTRTTVSGALSLWSAMPGVVMSFPGGRLSPGELSLNRRAGPLELIPLEGLRGLRQLHLEGVRPGDSGLEYIASLVELEELSLPRAGIHGPGLVHLHNMGGLRVLDLTGNPLDTVTAAHVAAWVELRELTLDHTNIKTLAPFATLGRLALKRLSVAGTSVDDEQLALLPRFSNLELLDLTGCARISDRGVAAHLPGLPRLEALALGGTSVSDAGVGRLSMCRMLRVLRLSDTSVTSEGLLPLSGLAQLTRLDLSGCAVDPAMLSAVSRFGRLERLDLRRTSLSAEEVAEWREGHADCEVIHAVDPLLEALGGRGQKTQSELQVAVEQVSEVEGSAGAGAGVLVTVTDSDLTDVGLARLAALEGLGRLVLNGVGITDAGLGPLESSTSLRKLDLSNTSITDHASTNLSRLVGLTELSLADTDFSDRGLSRLTGLEKLESLDLGGLSITADGLTAAVPRFQALRHLNLSETLVVNADLRFLGAARSLESLALRDTVISDRGIAAISSLKSLKRLWIERTRITEKGVEALQAALPDCEIFGP
jgi:Leucine-rich repeat (LRR) protein